MGYFAQIDEYNVVRDVIRVANEAMDGLPFPDSEPVGQAMLAESGFVGIFLQCSYSGSFRGCYPGQGYTYDPAADVFVPPAAPDAP